MITRNLLETIIRISKAASTDQTRPNLNTVHVFKRDNDVIVEAVDGYILARQVLAADLSSINDTDLVLWTHDLPNLKKFLKAQKGYNTFNVEITDHSVTVSNTVETVTLGRTQREFPRVDTVIPKDRPNTVTVGINPEFLMNLFEALKVNKAQCNVELSFDLNNLLAPMTVKVLNPSVWNKETLSYESASTVNQTGVIMGVKTDNMGVKGKLVTKKETKTA